MCSITLSRRSEKLDISRSSCFSASLICRLEEIKFSRKVGLDILLIAMAASDGIFGERFTIFVAVSFTDRIAASSSTSVMFISWATGETAARKKGRSEEHTSELQSRGHLVCRLLL